MKNILWQKESDFRNALEDRNNDYKYEIMSIEELLELGFNNNYLHIGDKEIELGWLSDDDEYKFDTQLTYDQLQVKVKYIGDDYSYDTDDNGDFIDSDGYHITRVKLVNEEDAKLFEEV